MDSKKILISAAFSGLLVGGCKKTGHKAEPGTLKTSSMVHCHGLNSCQGKGQCGGKGHNCAGLNACQGKGWLEISKEDCEKKGGKIKA